VLLKSLSNEQQQKIKELIDKDIDIAIRELEVVKSMEKKLRKRIKFLQDVKKSRQTIENYYRMLKFRYDSLEKRVGGDSSV